MMSSEEYDADCFSLYSDENDVLLKTTTTKQQQPPQAKSAPPPLPLQTSNGHEHLKINDDDASADADADIEGPTAVAIAIAVTANCGEKGSISKSNSNINSRNETGKRNSSDDDDDNDIDDSYTHDHDSNSDDVVFVVEGCDSKVATTTVGNNAHSRSRIASQRRNSRSQQHQKISQSTAVSKATTSAVKKSHSQHGLCNGNENKNATPTVTVTVPVPFTKQSIERARQTRTRSLIKDTNINTIISTNAHTNNGSNHISATSCATAAATAAFMSSATASAAGAAGGSLYGALSANSNCNNSSNSNSNQQPTSVSATNISTGNNNTAIINSPATSVTTSSASNSPSNASSLLTAAFGNLFGGANGAFGSAKMLNELFGRQMKQAQDATSGLPHTLDNAMLAAAMETATSAELLSAAGLVNSLNSGKLLNNNNNSINALSNGNNVSPGSMHSQTSPKSRRRTSNCSDGSLDGGADVAAGSPPRAASVSSLNGGASSNNGTGNTSPTQRMQHDLVAHHMLRNILQGKKELMQLDHELRTVMQQQQQNQQEKLELHKLNNNNSVAATNNNNNVAEKHSSSNSDGSQVINLIDTIADIKIKSEPQLANGQQPQPLHSPHGSHSSGDDRSSLRRKSSESLDSVAALTHDELQQSRTSVHADELVQAKKEAVDDILDDVELMGLNSRSDLESLASPSHSDMLLLDNSKDDVLEDDDDDDIVRTKHEDSGEATAGGTLKKPGMDLKRARVENIVSTMRCSPSAQQASHLQVNGCKKRKLYQPQQHAMERYVAAAAGLNFGLNLQSMMLDQDDTESNEMESPQIQQKRVEKNALKSQLRSMQEQLAEMQQKYVQLCTRMEQESECQELDNDNGSDSLEQHDETELSPSPTLTGDGSIGLHETPKDPVDRANSSSPPSLPTLKSGSAKVSMSNSMTSTIDSAPNMLTQMMSKMMSSKLHNPLVSHPSLPQSFNGPLPPLLQHMGDMSHAAAMYQQFFFEQEARMAKEAAEQQERQQQQAVVQHQHKQQQQQQQQHQLQQAAQQQQQEQHEQQRRFEQEQEQRRKEEQLQQQQLQRQLQQQQQQLEQQQQQHTPTTPLNQPTRPQLHHNARLPTRMGGASGHTALKSELSEKFNMLRSNNSNNSMIRMSGSDLEGLADVLKSEITTSLSALVDTIVTRFVHQRRLFSKQADSVTAAAEQLNKDLLLASQILDRKSPRTKVADRSGSAGHPVSNSGGSGISQNGSATTTQSGNNGSLLLANSQMPPSNTNNNNAPNAQQQQQQQQLVAVQQQQQHQQQQQQHQLHATVNNGTVNVPQHPLNQSQAMSAMAAAAAAAQNCQQLIAAPRLNGNQLSFPSPAAAAAAAMGLQMHHAAAAAAMSAAAVNHQQHAAGTSNNSTIEGPIVVANSTNNSTTNSSLSTLNIPPPHIRPSPTAAAMFQAPKTPQGMNPVAAAALYNSMTGGGPNPFCLPDQQQASQQQQQQQQTAQQQQTQQQLEQNEALSLVVTPKKKRHKVTDTRITPRTVSRILAQDGVIPPSGQTGSGAAPNIQQQNVGNCNSSMNTHHNNSNTTPAQSPSPRGQTQTYHPPPPPPMMPVSLPTSVAIPNPSLHESQVFSPYSPFFNPHAAPPSAPHGGQPTAQMHHMKLSSSPPGSLGTLMDSRDSPPLPHPPTMLHPALLAAAHHGASPDYNTCLRAAMDAQDRQSECNSAEMQFDGMQPTSSTLTPMHLRKAKLMFFWVRYPSSAVLKMYFPDIKFNKNNTAQLVKWFSNFREFYYIQMEKYARQAVTEGIKTPDDLLIAGDSELYRVLNLHYNRNNHIEVPQNFRFVVEQTLREFFRAIQGGKDTEQSWKKSIYKIISRMDDPVPEYFKSPTFLDQLE